MSKYYDLPQLGLSGPISCYHIQWRTKELLLFGDLHCPYRPGNFDLINFLKLIADKTNEKKICVDFFHELPFQKEEHYEYFEHSSGLLIQDIRINFGMLSKYYSNHYPYFRIHGWELSQYTKFANNNLLLWFIDSIGDIRMYNLIYDFYCNNENNKHDENFKELIEKNHHYSKYNFIFENEKFLSLLIHKQIRNIDTTYFEPILLFTFFKKTLSNLRFAILETYSISRMFRKFEHKERLNKCENNDVNNIIYFGGDDHVLNVFNFLKFLSEEINIKDIEFFYEFKRRQSISYQLQQNPCMDQQYIMIKLYNFFKLFPDKNDIKRMSSYSDSLPFAPQESQLFPNPKTTLLVPQVSKLLLNPEATPFFFSPYLIMEELFSLVKNYGYIVKSNELDGLKNWNAIKYYLSSISCDGLKWSIILKDLENKTLDINGAYNYIYTTLNMKGEDNEEEIRNNNWEKFHFFLQLARIPKNNKDCNLVRLCQIAYNLGQLSAVYNDVVYTRDVKQFFTINKLDKLSTYTRSSCVISIKNLESIRQLIDSIIVGAGYLYKYKKYKNKYLQIKNKL